MIPDFDSDDLQHLQGIADRVEDLGMFGLRPVVALLLAALITDGHVLLEGNPGLGKTALVRAMAQALELGRGSVGRIQFTPDLMPSDITGTLMPVTEPGGGVLLRFQPGPIFCRLLLADEINRATPKTQAAMLEAMAEFQVTVLGQTHDLRAPVEDPRERRPQPLRPPFMVMATQNPIDQEGTYDLPEAQLDRFLFKIRMALPGAEVLQRIVDKEIRVLSPASHGAGGDAAPEPDTVEGLARLARARRALSGLRLPPAVAAHVVNIVLATNGRIDELRGLSPAREKALQDHVAGRVLYPFGPRAAAALAKGALGHAAVALADPSAPQAVASWAMPGLAAVLLPALRHRIRLMLPGAALEGTATAEAQADDWLAVLACAAAPERPIADEAEGYHRRFEDALAAARAGSAV